jgi:phage-related protein
MGSHDKALGWVGSSKRDLLTFPKKVIRYMGYGLRFAQEGKLPPSSRILQGFSGASVIEIIDLDESGTYRVVYTIRFDDIVYVLHVFQKKSNQGIKTPKKEVDLIKARLKMAQQQFALRKRTHDEN